MRILSQDCGRYLVIMVLLTMMVQVASGQEQKSFATEGTGEIGGNISFQSLTPVANGVSGDATTIFAFSPFVGYFPADGFEIGLDPLGITSISSGGHSTTEVMFFVAPAYNFKTQSNVYPFIELLLGYTSQSNSSTESGFSWGGRGGVKVDVVSHALLNLGVEYLNINLNPSGAVNRYGIDEFALSAGFTVWL